MMASGVEEISQDTQLNTPQNIFWGSLPEDVVVKSGSYLSLQEIFKGMFLCKDFNRNNWVNKAIKHLNPRATPEDINAFLKSPFSKIPFYYAPQNATKHINKIFTEPGAWELTLSILNNKDHATGDQKLFVQKSLLYPEAIEFLKTNSAIMDQINLSLEEKKIINKRWSVLENLRARAPAEDIFQIVKNELYLDLGDLGWMFISTNSQVEIDNRFKAISELLRFENPDNPHMRPQAAKAWLSIATDNAVNFDNRLKAANKLRAWGEWGWGKYYKKQEEQAFLSIAMDNALNSFSKLIAVKALCRLGWGYKHPEIAQICLLIALKPRDEDEFTDVRIDAANILRSLGDPYTPQAAEAYFSIATDQSSHYHYRCSAAKALCELGYPGRLRGEKPEEWWLDFCRENSCSLSKARTLVPRWVNPYKPQATKACRSILETPGISEEAGRTVEEMLRALEEDE